ncbi:Exocyst complex component 5, partial [Linderina pennispora]
MMLENFEHAYKDNDVHNMKTAARTLDAFNGGVSVVKAYINQHPFFVASMVSQAQDSIADASYASMQGISDINAPPPPPDRWLEQLYDDTRKMMFKDWTVISEVFPRPVEVMQQLLKRVFEQTIQSYLETLLGRAERQSKLAFLRVLSSAHLATRKLIEDLQAFDAETITPAVTVLESARQSGNGMQGLLDMPATSQTAATEFSRRKTRRQPSKGRNGAANNMEYDDEYEDEDEQDAGARARLGAAKSGLSSAMAIAALIGRGESESAASGLLHEFLNRCCDDLFESYIAGDNYINAERIHFRDAVRQALQPFVRAREERQTAARGNAFLGIFTSVPLGSANTDKQQAESHGTVTIGTASFLLQIHAEAVARAIELESGSAVSDAVAELFSVLISLIGDSYVFPALDD